jgi:hypothetical protein
MADEHPSRTLASRAQEQTLRANIRCYINLDGCFTKEGIPSMAIEYGFLESFANVSEKPQACHNNRRLIAYIMFF